MSDVRAEEPRSESVAGELARALDRITDGVFTLDRNWVYTFLNPSGARLVGRTPEELVGRNIWTEFPEAVGSEFERRYREAFETQRVVTFEAWYEPFAMWYAVRVFPSSDGLTIYFQDITARRRAEDELAERARQQEALAKLSHRCITESDLERMLADAAGTVASTLDVARVEILGRSSEQSPTAVIARADCDRAVGALETATTIRVPIPGSALAVSDVVVYVDPERPLAADARDFISATAALISSCAQRIQQDRDARHAALHDTLTGLPNRRLLLSHLERALAARSNAGADVAVLMIGVDRFGLINNSFGHDAGDQLLIALAERLREAIGPHAILARPGGDRFVAVVEEPVADLEPTRIAERLHAAFHEPLSLTTGEHFITVSIGIANALSDTSAEALLRDADTALHRAKDRNGTAVFDEEARQAVVRHLALDRELHRALEREELRVFYQPILDLNSERPVAVEALVRWCHPQRGLVAPLEFIGPAEDNGLIIPIGLWVLQQACAQTAAWQREFGVPLQVCVNVSARQVADPSFARHAAQVADGAGLLPGTLELEITESLLMEEAGSPGSVLTELQEYGVRLALDDFGTGYSSLSYLRRFSVDTLKIDRAFVSDLGPGRDAAIVDAMIKMAHAVDLTVVAEGIETPEQKQLLAQLGCDRAQGYLFSRPLPADQLHGLLTA